MGKKREKKHKATMLCVWRVRGGKEEEEEEEEDEDEEEGSGCGGDSNASAVL